MPNKILIPNHQLRALRRRYVSSSVTPVKASRSGGGADAGGCGAGASARGSERAAVDWHGGADMRTLDPSLLERQRIGLKVTELMTRLHYPPDGDCLRFAKLRQLQRVWKRLQKQEEWADFTAGRDLDFAEPSSSRLHRGARVEVHGLSRTTEFNGMRGAVIKAVKNEAGVADKYIVALDGDSVKDRKIKAVNLKMVPMVEALVDILLAGTADPKASKRRILSLSHSSGMKGILPEVLTAQHHDAPFIS